ncbi:GTP cyclohydrolase II [Tieghemiomyces parasiticus]|uniref:GTP cyclohydrolase II n=1 Tax=Tieghemiomyces parasiticus TaxID=78921 RepID=A0A9W7ZWT2_9FUNG|nr:GTP cyclohydrolase II [Tieghemiomyces parasiticus]
MTPAHNSPSNCHCQAARPSGTATSEALEHILPDLLKNATAAGLTDRRPAHADGQDGLPTPPELTRSSSATGSAAPASAGSEAPGTVAARCMVRARIPFPDGQFHLYLYHNTADQKEHLAIVFGEDIDSTSLNASRSGESELDRLVRGARPRPSPATSGDEETEPSSAPLVRIHSECFTGETVSSVRCDCGYQLAEAMRLMQLERRGVIIYLRQEGRGIGLMEKLKAYNLQDMGHDTVTANLLLNHPADARNYDVAYAMLRDLELNRVRLLTNNPDKIDQLVAAGIDVEERVPMVPRWWQIADGSLTADQVPAVHEDRLEGNTPLLGGAAGHSPIFTGAHYAPTADESDDNGASSSGTRSPADSLELSHLSLADRQSDDVSMSDTTPSDGDAEDPAQPPSADPVRPDFHRFASGTSLRSAASNLSSPSTLIWSPLSPGDGIHSHLASSKHLFPLPSTRAYTSQPTSSANLHRHGSSDPLDSLPTPGSPQAIMAEANRYLQVKVQRMGHLLDLPRSKSSSNVMPTAVKRALADDLPAHPAQPQAHSVTHSPMLSSAPGPLKIRTQDLGAPHKPSPLVAKP